MSTVYELDLRAIAPGELFSTLYQTYRKLDPGTRLRAIVDTNPCRSYMGFVEAGVPQNAAIGAL